MLMPIEHPTWMALYIIAWLCWCAVKKLLSTH